MCTSTKQNVDTSNKILQKTIVENQIVVEQQSKPYSYAAAVLNSKNMAIADSGTTGHFLQINSECVDKRQTDEGLNVHLPDGLVITSTHTAMMNIPQLPMKARRAHMFPDISHAFLSISMLCDEDYMAIFDEKRVYIIKNGNVLLHGIRDSVTNLYVVNMSTDNNTVQPPLSIKHMENLGIITKFANNACDMKAKKI